MKSEPVFSVVSRSASGGCSRSLALAAALGGDALPGGFLACGVKDNASTSPRRGHRACRYLKPDRDTLKRVGGWLFAELASGCDVAMIRLLGRREAALERIRRYDGLRTG